MTVSRTPRSAGPFVGNGVTTAFPFTFKVFNADDLEVTFTDANGVASVITTGYTVALNADQNANPGGTLTYPSAGSPMVAPATLSVVGDAAYEQRTDLRNAGRFLAEVIENALDLVTVLAQQLLEKVGRALVFPAGDSATGTLPSAAQRAGKFLAFGGGGAPVASSGTGADAGLRTDLAAPNGALLSGFEQSGVGAVARDMQAKAREWYSDADVGLTGVGDETAKLLALFTNCVESGKPALLTKSAYTVSGNILPSDSRAGARTLSIHCQVPVTITVDAASVGFDYLMYLNTTAENNVFFTGCSLTVFGNNKCGTFLRADNNGADNTGIVDVQSKVVLKNLKKTAADLNTNGGMLFLGPYQRVTIREPEIDTIDRTAVGGDTFGVAVSGFTGLVEIYEPRISRVLCTGDNINADGIKVFGKAAGGVLTSKRMGTAVIYGGLYTDNQGRQIKSQCSETTIINPTSIRQGVVSINNSVDFDFQCGNGLLLEPSYIYKKNGGVSPLGASHTPVIFQQILDNEQMSGQAIGGKMVTEVGMQRYCVVTHVAAAKESITRVKGLRVLPFNGFATSAFTANILETRADTIEAKADETILEVSDCKGPMLCYGIGYSAYGGTSLAGKLSVTVADNVNTLTGGLLQPAYKTSGTAIRAFKSFLFKNNTGFRSLYSDLDFTVSDLPVGCCVTAALATCVVTGGPGWAAAGNGMFHCVNQYFGATGKGVWAIKDSAAVATTMYFTQDGGTTWGQIK